MKIYGGSASSEPLSTGADTDTFNCLAPPEENELTLELSLAENVSADESDSCCETAGNKRKSKYACIKLIDNKRKHMERTLSAAQRDQLLLKEGKEEMNFNKEMTDVMRESSKNTASAISQMTTAIENIGSGLSWSIEMLASALANQQQQPNQQQWPVQPSQFNNFTFPRPNTNIQPWLGEQYYSQMPGQQEMQPSNGAYVPDKSNNKSRHMCYNKNLAVEIQAFIIIVEDKTMLEK